MSPSLGGLPVELLLEILGQVGSYNDLIALVWACPQVASIYLANKKAIFRKFLQHNLTDIAIETALRIKRFSSTNAAKDLPDLANLRKPFDTLWDIIADPDLQHADIDDLRFLLRLYRRYTPLVEAAIEATPEPLDPQQWSTVPVSSVIGVNLPAQGWLDLSGYIQKLRTAKIDDYRDTIKPRLFSGFFIFDLLLRTERMTIPDELNLKYRSDGGDWSRALRILPPGMNIVGTARNRKDEIFEDMGLVSWMFLRCRWQPHEWKSSWQAPSKLNPWYEPGQLLSSQYHLPRLVNAMLWPTMKHRRQFKAGRRGLRQTRFRVRSVARRWFLRHLRFVPFSISRQGIALATKTREAQLATFFWIAQYWLRMHHEVVTGHRDLAHGLLGQHSNSTPPGLF